MFDHNERSTTTTADDDLCVAPAQVEGMTDELLDSFSGGALPGTEWSCYVGTCNKG